MSSQQKDIAGSKVSSPEQDLKWVIVCLSYAYIYAQY